MIMRSSTLSERGFVCNTTTNHNLHIAIDFGTDGLGVAYAFNNDVYIHEWSSTAHRLTSKPKCIALFDSKQNLVSFGIDAKHQYIQKAPQQRKTWMLFEQFKMSLYAQTDEKRSRSAKSCINKTLTATNGKQLSSEKVFVAVFKYIYDECVRWLRPKGIQITDDIEWIIAVPAIWNDEARNCMKRWAKAAELKNIRIVYEADCASLSIQYCMNNAGHSLQKGGDLKFKKGDKYILVDGGGGTVDVAAHEILSTFGVKEVLPPSGDRWGSLYIDDKFNDLLNRIFGKDLMQKWKSKYPLKYMKLMDNFTIAKHSCFQRKNQEYHNVELPLEFIEYMDDKCADLKDMIKKTFGRKDIKKVKLEDEYLKMNIKLWQYMFDKVQDALLCHIKQLLHENTMRDCMALALVGGLSCSPYFVQRMEEEFGIESRYKLKVIIPSAPRLCVVEGAAYFGITKNYIKARRLSKTYGVRVNLPLATAQRMGIPEQHIIDNLAYNKESKECHIRNCFEIMAVKGEEVLTNEVKIKKSKRLNCNQQAIIKYIICSDLKNPKVLNDGSKLGEIKLEFGKDVDDMSIYTEFHFYDTMLKVFVYPASKPELRKEIDLSYAD